MNIPILLPKSTGSLQVMRSLVVTFVYKLFVVWELDYWILKAITRSENRITIIAGNYSSPLCISHEH